MFTITLVYHLGPGREEGEGREAVIAQLVHVSTQLAWLPEMTDQKSKMIEHSTATTHVEGKTEDHGVGECPVQT